MKRRNFLLTSLLVIPLGSFAKFKNFVRAKKGIKISKNESLVDGQIVPIGSDGQASCKVSTTDTDGNLTFFSTTATQNIKGGPPLHLHFNQDEIFYVVEGEFTIQVGDEQYNMKEGDTVFAPRQVPHTFSRVGEKTGKLLTIFQPSGKMEDFMNTLNSLTGMPKPEEIAKLFEEHGMKIVGPPLPIK